MANDWTALDTGPSSLVKLWASVTVHRRSFLRNTLTSIATTALDLGVLTGLVEIFGVHYVVATWVGTVVGALSNFAINRSWSFAAQASHARRQLVRFVPVQVGSSALQTAGVWLFTRFGGVQYVGSKLAIAAIVYLVWNYPLNRFFVFRRPPPTGARADSAP